ncbi:hypothetical protein V5799_005814, partial [Amblyomma americanum]
GWFWRRPVHSSTSMDPAAPQNPDILLRSAARLPLAWVLLHHGIQVFLLRSMARLKHHNISLRWRFSFIAKDVRLMAAASEV